MRIRTYAPTHQLTFLPSLFPINVYLVEEDDGLTLVDTGLAPMARRIASIVESMKRPLKRIALTHPHGDHVGGLDGLKALYPDAEVLISARDTRLLAGDMTRDVGETQSEFKGRLNPVNTRPDTLLSDGDRVGSLLAVSCPGHTPGQMFFFDERNGAAILGDVLQTRAGLTIAGEPNTLFPFVGWATWDPALAARSAERLLDYDVHYVMAGHGNVLEEPRTQLKLAVARAQKAHLS